MKTSKSDEQCLGMPKISEIKEQDLGSDIKLTVKVGQNLETKLNKNNEQTLLLLILK